MCVTGQPAGQHLRSEECSSAVMGCVSADAVALVVVLRFWHDRRGVSPVLAAGMFEQRAA
uniref:Uncharacterized protein n=1 Tax=Peronospora matthiolae TaxID=2874970 RepID=A0AAV1TPZ0_9STRA